MSSQQLSSPDRPVPLPARAAVSLENDDRLDPMVSTMARVTAPLGDSATGSALRGEWMGHALHPSLTDLPLGLWTAASVLDFLGGPDARPAAQRLLGVGLIAAAPTAVSGWAEWTRVPRPAQRVGLAHAALNVAAIGLYAGSWAARHSERHRVGAALAVAGAGVASAAAYLGGHLAAARAVASRHPALGPQPHGEADRTVSGDDVVAAVAAQHARITMMVMRVTTSPMDDKAGALRDLLGYLAGHEAVEEELIHPLLPRIGDREQGLARAREEAGMAQQLVRLGQLEPGSPSFDTQLGLFEDALSRHASAEEHEELPELARHLTHTDATLILDALAAHESAASTREGSWAEMLEAARSEVRAQINRHTPAHR